MEQKILKIILIQLKIIAAACFALMIFILSGAFRAEKFMDDFWKQLGISKAEGEGNFEASFMRGYIYSYGATHVRNIATADKVAVTKDFLAYCKRHVNSEGFKKHYVEFRITCRPGAPILKTREQIQKELISDYEEAVRNDQSFVNLALTMKNERMKRTAEKSLAVNKKLLEQVTQANSQLIRKKLQCAELRYTSEWHTYETRIQEWEKKFPKDSRQLVRTRLQQFLEMTDDIDFSAQLKHADGKKIFIDPEYEHKPAEWKMGFRAGKEVVQTARSFAGEWMRELN